MANFEIPGNPEYIENIRKFETTDPAHADLFNSVIQSLVNNETFLKKVAEKQLEKINQHTGNLSNPHEVMPEHLNLENVNNTSDMDKPVSNAMKEMLDIYYEQSAGYTDKEISDLIGGAPTTLDTLKEISDAIMENDSVVEALDVAIGTKAAQADMDGHTNNKTVHITASERIKWNDKYVHPATSGNKHIPSGGSTGQILRWSADGTAAWGADNNTTYSAFKGATSSAAGGNGLVPAPAAGKQTQFLRGDGTWQATPDTNTWRGIQNNLTSTSTTESLAAAQGKALNDRITQLNTNLIDKIYPVGSIYMSVNNVSPAIFIGGTWEPIRDMFLLSAGNVYAAGTIGGAATVALTAAQMPAHNHTFTGTAVAHSHTFTGAAVVSGGNSASHTHSVTAKGSVASTFSGTAVKTTEGGNHTHSLKCAQLALDPTNNHGITYLLSSASANYSAMASAGAHTHNVTAKGSVASTFSGTAVNTGGNSVSHTHSVTAKGTNSNASIIPSGTIGSTGSGAAHSNMPPYLTVYMWKRTA